MSKNTFSVDAELRTDNGKGASRRLRRSDKVPGIVYGASKDAVAIAVSHNEMLLNLQHEAFYSQVLDLKIGGKKEAVVLRDLQRHPSKPRLLHVDFQRVRQDEAMHVNLPLHFLNEESCVGVKQGGGVISKLMTEVEVSCLPKDLPEYIELDVANLELGATIHLSELILPEGVTSVALSHADEEHDTGIVTVYKPRVEAEPEAEEAGEAAESEAAAEESKEDGDTKE